MTVAHSIQPAIVYPESDGKPMGETDDHRDLMTDLIFALRHQLGPDTYVSGNLFIYYVEGEPAVNVCPDVFVMRAVPQRRRRVFKTWEHNGKTPDVVIELTSRSTRTEDLGTKRLLYADLGVKEYFIFDPLGEYLQPQLRAYELVDGELIPVAGQTSISRVLNLELRPEGHQLRLYDLRSRERLPTPDEETDARRQEAEARRQEAEARQAAEAENAELRAEIERLRAAR